MNDEMTVYQQTLDPFKGLTGKAPTTHGKP